MADDRKPNPREIAVEQARRALRRVERCEAKEEGGGVASWDEAALELADATKELLRILNGIQEARQRLAVAIHPSGRPITTIDDIKPTPERRLRTGRAVLNLLRAYDGEPLAPEPDDG